MNSILVGLCIVKMLYGAAHVVERYYLSCGRLVVADGRLYETYYCHLLVALSAVCQGLLHVVGRHAVLVFLALHSLVC